MRDGGDWGPAATVEGDVGAGGARPDPVALPFLLPPPLARSNYRACVRAHKLALSAQRSFWMALLHDTIHFKSLQKSFAVMNAVRLGRGPLRARRSGAPPTRASLDKWRANRPTARR